MAIEYISDKKCRLVVYNGTDLKGRQKRYKKTVTYTSKRNAEKQYREFEQEIINGMVNSGNVTLSEIVDLTIRHSKQNGARLSTLRGYEKQKQRILNTLGNPKAKNVTNADIELWVTDMFNVPYSIKTVRDTLSLLSRAYQRAIALRQLNTNPCDGVRVPKIDHRKTKRKSLGESTIEQYFVALNEESNLDVAMVIKLALFLGMRRSEILALKEDSIDYVNRQLIVEEGRHLVDGVEDITMPKSGKSYRALALNDILLNDIRLLIKSHEGHGCDYLIHDSKGKPPKPDSVSAWVRSFAKRHNVEYITLHGLRHSYATILFHEGLELTDVQNNLGHAYMSTTADIYMHEYISASASSRKSADRIEELYKSLTK